MPRIVYLLGFVGASLVPFLFYAAMQQPSGSGTSHSSYRSHGHGGWIVYSYRSGYDGGSWGGGHGGGGPRGGK